MLRKIFNSFRVSYKCLEEGEPHRTAKLDTKFCGKKGHFVRFLQKKLLLGKYFLEGSKPLSTAEFSKLALKSIVFREPIMAFLSSKPQAQSTTQPAL